MPQKLLLLLLLCVAALTLAPNAAHAAPGDTTRVTIWNQRKLTHYGTYDTTATLPAPGLRYRKILMHYILGRYACAPGSQYCGSWDYTTRVMLRPPAHDTVELARVITPYATDWLTRNLSHDYVVDITEYAPLLKSNRAFQFEYQGYSWGFTVTMRLEFIEGIPPQDPVDVRNVYSGVFAYGNASDPINSHLPVRTLTAPATGTVRLKSIITGHGSDAGGCAEFCSRYYNWSVNGQSLPFSQSLWRMDCGVNEVYPQTGTWVYNRGNWCPGAYVNPIWHSLTGLTTPGQPFTFGIAMPGYTATSPSAQYIWSSQLVTSGPINFVSDASIDAIVSPNVDDNYLRENPNCGGPQVRLRNWGSSRLTAATISYRVDGRGTTQTYNWTGSLPFGRDTLVALPALTSLLDNNGGRFRTWVSSPNGAADQNHANDTLSSRFAPTLLLPTKPVISMTTNNARTGIYNQTSWRVYDVAGNIVAQRVQAVISTTYNDTLNLPGGCYSLRVTDTNCDGFAWWASSATTGAMSIKYGRTGATLRTISGDFGCEYVLNFRLPSTPTATVAPASEAALTVYPNPSADGHFTLNLKLAKPQALSLHVTDALGRTVHTRQLPLTSTASLPLDLHQLPAGIYTLDAALADGQHVFRQLAIQ